MRKYAYLLILRSSAINNHITVVTFNIHLLYCCAIDAQISSYTTYSSTFSCIYKNILNGEHHLLQNRQH